MPDLNLYWAEEALGEPYAPQDYAWLKSTRRLGLMLGGATCALTAGAFLSAAVFHLVDSSPRVPISSYEMEELPAAPISTARVQITPTVAAVMSKAPSKTNQDNKAVASRTSASAKATPAPSTAGNRKPTLAQTTAPIDTPSAKPPPPAAVPARATVTPTVAGSPDRNVAAKVPETPPAAKQEPETRIGISRGAENKPADIASGEKLGIREILVDGIVMHNGRKVKSGSALPNGEILIGTDPGKGMAETDRRVLVLTP